MIWYFNADVAHVSHLTRVPQLISVEAHIEMSSHTWSVESLLRHETLVSRDDQSESPAARVVTSESQFLVSR